MIKHEPKKGAANVINPLLALVLAGWLMLGCSLPSLQRQDQLHPPDVPSTGTNERGWWYIRFRMDRPGGETRWENDLLIAHRIVSPILSSTEKEIGLWRFHRRSNDDGAGHQFSFIFYSRPEMADRINRQVLNDPLLQKLIADGVIKTVLTDAVDRNTRTAISATSDSNWSPVMQNTWPYFIMGVSRMWLGMIAEIEGQIESTAGTPEGDDRIPALIERYRTVNDQVTHIWQQEGYHALLHHLNAIYGYKPLIFWEKRWKAF